MYIPELKNQLGEIAAHFYGYPAKQMRIVGVTGTSGKTSCTHFIADALHQLHVKCGLIGTSGNGFYGALQVGNLTTPDAITIQKLLADFLQHDARIAAMEVSSHALDQARVNSIRFAVGVFTNLTPEHLDWHGTMEAYGAAKAKIFSQAENIVINAEDQFGRQCIQSEAMRRKVYAYGNESLLQYFPAECHQNILAVTAKNICCDIDGIHADVSTPWGSGKLNAPLAGEFNLANVLAVITTLCILDVPFENVLNCISQLGTVAGRMEFAGGNDRPLVVVDYAHKPDALEKVLQALRSQCLGKLFCIFGCGGGRDRGKRVLMAKIAERYSDQVVVTDDNARDEDPAMIVKDIMGGFSDVTKVAVQHDRSRAIHETIQRAAPSDCILVAGKGAETYQIMGGRKMLFNDMEQVRSALGRLK